MRRRIYGGMFIVTLISLVLASFFLSFLFYRMLESQIKEELKSKARLLSVAEYHIKNDESLFDLLSGEPGMRVTLIMDNGKVLFDSEEDAAIMDNHAGRPEIIGAAETGLGESTRTSDTTHEQTYYYAIRLENGYYLRVAKNMGSIFDMLAKALPAAMVIIMGVMAGQLWIISLISKRIVEPISKADIKNPDDITYDELTPFVRTIQRQRKQITEQQRDIEHSGQTTQEILDNMREGFIMLSQTGVVVMVNQSAMRIFGVSQPCVGLDAIHLTRNMQFLEKVKQAINGQNSDMLLEQARTYQVYFNPTTLGGAIILFVDISEVQAAERIRREFTANVSHELKTPLTSISGYAEIMLAGMVDTRDITHFLGRIKDESSRMISLVNDIMFLSRLDENIGVREFEIFDIMGLAAEVTEARRDSAESRGVKLALTGQPCKVEAGRVLIYEMLVNLVDNGIKYNVPGGSVTVEILPNDNQVCVSVIDTGIGIASAHLSRVFERFYRVDPSRSKKTGGTGLGLSIVKHIAQYHGGTVAIRSGVGEGTIITVMLNAVE